METSWARILAKTFAFAPLSMHKRLSRKAQALEKARHVERAELCPQDALERQEFKLVRVGGGTDRADI